MCIRDSYERDLEEIIQMKAVGHEFLVAPGRLVKVKSSGAFQARDAEIQALFGNVEIFDE